MTDAALLHSDAPALEGQLVGGKYCVSRLIGTGGMGTVWEGVHEQLGTRVAIKFIKPQFAEQPEARARFQIEARAAAKLKTKHAKPTRVAMEEIDRNQIKWQLTEPVAETAPEQTAISE